jgi:tetratricopeptide (TPR) repeat protein
VLSLEGVLPAFEKAVEPLDAAIAESPKDAALRLARLRVKKDAPSAQAALEFGEDARVHDAALAVLKEKMDAAKADDAAALFGALEPAIGRASTRGRALAMKGAALLRNGKKEEAKAAFEQGFGPGVPATAELVTQIEELGDDALTERACKAFFESLKGEGAQAAMMNLWQEKSPLHTLTRMLARQKRHGEFYHAIKGIELGMGMGVSIFFTIREDQQEFLKAAGSEAMKDRSELAGLKWLARSFSGPYAQMFARGGMGVDPVTLWEKAREWVPDDLEPAQALVEILAERNEHGKAVKAAEELLKLLDKGIKPGPRGWARERAHLAIATSLKESGDEEGAKAALAKVDLMKAELAPHEVFAAGTLLAAVKQLEAAAAMLLRLEEEGFRPYMHLAAIYEKLLKYDEAVRHYNRAIRHGYDDKVPAPGDMYRVVQLADEGAGGPRKDRSAAPQKARADLMKKLGENYFIDKLLDGPLDKMTADEESRAKSLVAELSGDELEGREGAIDALRKMGVKTAPVLRVALTSSGDDEVKTRVRALLNEWAEPR